MSIKRLVIVCLLPLVSTVVIADGKMYWRETVPPGIPYQRATILYKNGIQTLILQSKYDASKTEQSEQSDSLGWVVPVPNVPEVASLNPEYARYLYMGLELVSRSYIIRTSDTLLIVLFLGTLAAAVLVLVTCLFPIPVLSSKIAPYRNRLFHVALILTGICLGIAIITPGLLTTKGGGVDIVDEQRVGIYDVRVLKSDDASALIDWLNANEFQFDQTDTSVFSSYIARGWCFVVAKINPSEAQQENGAVASEGLAAPLILRFASETPIYPVALTGTGGYETEILIYLIADQKMTCRDRLKLRYAGPYDDSAERLRALMECDPKGFFSIEDLTHSFLCKFRSTLTPEQMNDDIVFIPADDNQAYRERITRW